MLEFLTYNAYPTTWHDAQELTKNDRVLVKELVTLFRDAAQDPRHEPLREAWRLHNEMKLDRPLVAVWAENFLEMKEICELHCESRAGQQIEFQLRQLLWQYHNVLDDKPLECWLSVPKVVESTGWGLEVEKRMGHAEGDAWGFVPLLNGWDDFKKLRIPTLSYDTVCTQRRADGWRELLGDILPIRITGTSEVGFHLCMQYSLWRGLSTMYEDFYEEPALLKDVLDFLVDGELNLMTQRETLGLLDTCFDGTYQGTGGFQYWRKQPAPGEHILRSQIWGHAEAQELAQVSPKMHREVLLTRERKLLEGFARTEYGCCEPLHDKLADVLKLPNIVKVSASPWAKLEPFAELMPDNAIISWKPNPAWLTQQFDEKFLRAEFSKGVKTLKNKRFEVVLGDLRSCAGQPDRIARWVDLVKKSIDENM